jgi:hypothetical protein
MMNKLVIFLTALLLFACNRKPFVNHKLKFEKVADDCRELQTYFRLNSNFGGERYEFEKCLPANFNEDQLKSERKGDTVVVSFPDPAIDQDTYTIVPTEK